MLPSAGSEWTLLGALLIVVAIVLAPIPALAFGPIAHLDMGLELLGSASLFAAGVTRLIRRYPDAFLRGTLDPDRSLAKNLASYERHSHNWQHAFQQYQAARTEEERAAFLGYLCHLAADAVAHNSFVPLRMVQSWRNPTAGHLYWEMRLDAQVRRMTGASLLWLADPTQPAHRDFLRRTVRPSLPGKGWQVHVTGLVLRVQRGRVYGNAADLVDRRSRIPLDAADVQWSRSMAMAAQQEILTALGDSAALGIDPRGIGALRQARTLRRELRGLRTDGAHDEIDRRLEAAQRQFQQMVVPGMGDGSDAGLTIGPRTAILRK
jgi:hypothetical protein